MAAGETLQSIAKSAYGDSSLWYLIADANGLSGDRDLRVGQTLTVPSRVTGARNSSNSFKPYNPGELVGNSTPNLPSPPAGGGRGGCGGLGMIIMIAVVVVATIYTAGAATGALASGFSGTMTAGMTALGTAGGMTFGTAALAYGVGNLAGQVAGNLMGMQNGINWTSVATSAIGGGISAGLGGTGGPMQGSSFGMTVGRAIVGNALTQGVSVITGMQKEFNWTQVATSAVTAGVSYGLNGVLNAGGAGAQAARPEGLEGFAQNFGKGLITNTVMTVARGGRVQGEQIFTDAFGNTLGSSVADASTLDTRRAMAAIELSDEVYGGTYTGPAPGAGGSSPAQGMPEVTRQWLSQSFASLDTGVVSDAGGDTDGADEPFTGTGLRLTAGDGKLRLNANSISDTSGGEQLGVGVPRGSDLNAVLKGTEGGVPAAPQEQGFLDKTLGILRKGVQALTAAAIGAKELAFGIVKLPFDFVGGMVEAVSNHLGGRVAADVPGGGKNSFLYDLLANPLSAMKRSASDTLESAAWGFTHFNDPKLDDSFGASFNRLANAVPLVGRYLSGGASVSPTGDGSATTYYSAGIHQNQGDFEDNKAAGDMMRADGAPPSRTIQYKDGTFIDTLFGALNLNNGASAHFANQVAARGESKVDLVGHSGGVQVVAGASSYLGDIGIAVDHLVGIQGPTMGRYNNAQSITLMGNGAIGSGFDPVSSLGRVGANAVFGNNLQTDFTVRIPDNMESHISPKPGDPIGDFWIRKVNEGLRR